ncbi:hypothetical protein FVEN_g10090 [Fusarium venenatum]|uniref:Uncharacterized protein n=1 Tax=Fusarium venenatum TaxID=56646 RepID=A0A2L2SQI2_9HYPO|nr:uncharacterized protein FVRRES_11702 [Fusarium venenatum]KAG8351879.1 hypothetical protein FVEN_g10090 [Fusarium venenatum]KAH6978372.1 hypothetical protein EDB82DRAFT_526471 [Fusarium venenatum]CEI39011.1 unnamed protein product [Fusarium venenatum]
MALTSANVDLWSSACIIHARGKKCFEWDCLTSSEQGGIITTVVVTSIILLLVCMYYLGRIIVAHQEIAISQRRRRRRRRQQQRTNLARFYDVALVQLPVVPQYPSENVVYAFSPFVYHPHGQINDVQNQTTRILIPQQPVLAVTPLHAATYAGYPVADVQGQRSNYQANQRPISVLTSAPSENIGGLETDWWGRLRRVFGLPLGRASTIATDSVPTTPVLSPSGENGSRREPRLGRLGPERTRLSRSTNFDSGHTLNAGNSHANPQPQDNVRREITTIQSPPSVVATVHSDDFDIV